MIGPFVSVAVFGLVHGLEPGHGWPLAVALAHRRGRPYAYGALAAAVLGLGHLASSFAVVGVYMAFDAAFDLSSDIFRYVAGSLILILAVRFWLERPHGEAAPDAASMGLRSLAVAALVLGFAHEEEFALLGLAIGGLNPVALMSVYAVAVLVAMVAVTQASIALFRMLPGLGNRVAPYLTKVSAVVLVALAVQLFVGIR